MAAVTSHFLILYASQTGNAQSIAEGLREEAEEKGFNSSVYCTNEFDKDKFPFAQEQNIIFVVSTTGEGEPPDHALRYWRKLKRKTLPSDFLKHINYTLLGLGDSNYTNFCNNGKMFDKRMRELGATAFYEPGFADDGVGLELVVEPWIDGLWDAMRKLISVSAVPKDAAKNGLSSEVDDSTLDVLDTVVQKERNVDAKVPTTKSRDTSLPPLTATTSSPQIGRRKNAGEDVVPTKLASLPANKSVTSSNTSSSSPLVSRTNPVAAVPAKPSPLSSPRLKHLELEHLSARVSAPSLGPPPTVLTPNQLWTGYRKGALKPIEGKSGDVADIDDQRRDENFLFGVPSKTFLAPLEGRARSISLIAADCTENNEGDLDVTQSSPNLPQYPPDALEAEHVPGEVLVSGIEEVVEGIGSASVKGDMNTAQDNLGDGDIHTVLESGIPDETVNSTVPPDAEGAVSAVLERLRTLTCPLEQSLTTPSLQPSFLNVDLQCPQTPLAVYPISHVSYGPNTRNFTALVRHHQVLTSADAVKVTMEMTFDVKEEDFQYEPGDAFGFVCPNDAVEVDYLMQRLGLQEVKDHRLGLSLMLNTQARKPVLPKHIPPGCTVRQYLLHCADIRGIPKKSFLFQLAGFTSDPVERRRLEELSSRQGAADYTKLFVELHLDLLDVLAAFPSCQPTLQFLIENLPRLQPRFYSAASSPLVARQQFKIVFSVTELPDRVWNSQKRRGLATGWFADLCSSSQHTEIIIFSRGLNPFHLPMDLTTPTIMCGPGTGVAPLMGFLEHLTCLQGTQEFGESWLFFGCRHPQRDHLYRSEMAAAVERGVLSHCSLSYSRFEAANTHYIQDAIRWNKEELGALIMERNAVVYVCGDAKNMAKDIKDAFFDVISSYIKAKGLSGATDNILMKMRENGRYILDIWG